MAGEKKQGDGRPRLAAPGVGGRLRVYLIGVGIGVILLGMFALLKQQAAQQQGTPPPPGAAAPSSP